MAGAPLTEWPMSIEDLRHLHRYLRHLAELSKQEEGDEEFEAAEEDIELYATAEGFGLGIRNAVRDLWRGDTELALFLAAMLFVIRAGFTRAWETGAQACGITPQELTPEEIRRREQEIILEVSFVNSFALDILAFSRAAGGTLAPFLRRAEMWANRFGAIQGLATSMACQDQKLMWIWNPLKDHCSDCAMYNGRVYRASTWAKYDIYPKMPSLECHGKHCGCSFVVTDASVTPGRPPEPGG